MARAALGWGVRDLARAAKVSVDTVGRFERGEPLKERTVEAIQRALEAAGVEFTNGRGGAKSGLGQYDSCPAISTQTMNGCPS
jgi:transcriptional regulator with XRE-family HTH domain